MCYHVLRKPRRRRTEKKFRSCQLVFLTPPNILHAVDIFPQLAAQKTIDEMTGVVWASYARKAGAECHANPCACEGLEKRHENIV